MPVLASISSRTVGKDQRGREFNRVIKLDIRDSVPGLAVVRTEEAAGGAPNVLIVLYDDTGLAAWSPTAAWDQHADHGPARRQRHHLHPMAHHRAVLPTRSTF